MNRVCKSVRAVWDWWWQGFDTTHPDLLSKLVATETAEEVHEPGAEVCRAHHGADCTRCDENIDDLSTHPRYLEATVFGPVCETCKTHGVPELHDICWECELLATSPVRSAPAAGANTSAHGVAGADPRTVEAMMARIEGLEARIQAIGERLNEIRESL